MEHSNHSEHRQDGMGHAMQEGHRETGSKDEDHTGHHAHMAADLNGYLSVGHMHLYDNPLLKQTLKLAQMSVGTRADCRESCVHDLPVE